MKITIIEVMLVIAVAYLYYKVFTNGKIKGNKIKNEKGETIYKVED